MEYGIAGHGIYYLAFRLLYLIPLVVVLDIVLRERLIFKYSYKSKVMDISRMIIVLPIPLLLGMIGLSIGLASFNNGSLWDAVECIGNFVEILLRLICPTIYAYYIFIILEIIVFFKVRKKL